MFRRKGMNKQCLRYLGLAAVAVAGVMSIIGSGGGGGGGTTPPPSVVTNYPRYAFVVSHDDDSVSSFVVDSSSGRLKFISRVATGSNPVAIAIDPAGEYAYVANNFTNGSDGTISKYSIGTDGSLTAIGTPTGITPSIGLASVSVDPSSKYVYAANSESDDVLIYAIQSDGDLVLVPCAAGPGVICGTPNSSAFATGNQPRFVAVDPGGKYAYVANALDNDVSQYNIAADGTLTQMTTPTVPVGSGPWSITISPGGNRAYIALSGTTTVATFTIGADGSLAFLDSDISGTSPRSVAVDPFDLYAYVANYGAEANSASDNVAQFKINADGSLTSMSPFPTVPVGDKPSSVIVDPSGKYTYVANSGADDTVSQFMIGVSGQLAANAPSVISVRPGPRSLAMTGGTVPVIAVPKYAYVANKSSNSVSQFTIGTDGKLSPMTPASVLTGTAPVSVAVDASGRYAYVANSGTDNSVSQFTIQSDGKLAPMTPATVAAGTDPVAVAVDPSGRYVYTANSGSNDVSAYTIGNGTGALVQINCGGGAGCNGANFLAGTVPAAVTIHPSGRYVYVANSGTDNSVSQFTVQSDGKLAPVTPASVLAQTAPVSVAIDPAGKYAYVANRVSNTVSQYTIGGNGVLTPMATPIVITEFVPVSVTVDPGGKYVFVTNSGIGSNSVSQFKIGSGGSLTALTPSSVSAGNVPVSVTTVGTWN